MFIATGGYAGYFPVAPGTVGSLVGVILYLFLYRLYPLFYFIIILHLFFLGVWSSGEAENILNKKDHHYIVIDEIVGLLLTMFLLPEGVWFIIGGFLLFRLLDILKPFHQIERMKGGFGVMLDDLVAGIIANLILQSFRLF
ncbi:MAG: phosphatidylglycerophosphatase A [Nitrospinae bacterium]|nr:phosphatidylglycerophosphatase A [Nitrospinota bacterium]